MNVRDEYKDFDTITLQKIYKENSVKEKIGCLNLTCDHNIAMIVRSASLFGISELYIIGRRRYNKRPTVGTHKYIPTILYKCTIGSHNDQFNITLILQFLEKWSQTHTIVFVEQGGIPLTNAFSNASFIKPAFFILGNEGHGIPIDILNFQPSIRVSIPQKGIGRSFNVANATSIVLWEYFRDKTL